MRLFRYEDMIFNLKALINMASSQSKYRHYSGQDVKYDYSINEATPCNYIYEGGFRPWEKLDPGGCGAKKYSQEEAGEGGQRPGRRGGLDSRPAPRSRST